MPDFASTLPEEGLSLDGHCGSVFCIVELPEKSLVATACVDGFVRVFDSTTAELSRTLPGHHRDSPNLVPLGDGLLMATAATGWHIVWNTGTGDVVSTQKLNSSSGAMASLGTGHLVVSDRCDLVFLEHDRGRSMRETRRVSSAHGGSIEHLAVCGGRFATASFDRTAKVWCARSGLALATLEGHDTAVSCVDLSESWIVTGSADSTICIYHATSFGLVQRMSNMHASTISDVRLHLNRFLVSFSLDEAILVSEVPVRRADANVPLTFEACAGIVLSDGRLAVAGARGNAKILNCPKPLQSHRARFSGAWSASAGVDLSSLAVLNHNIEKRSLEPLQQRGVSDDSPVSAANMPGSNEPELRTTREGRTGDEWFTPLGHWLKLLQSSSAGTDLKRIASKEIRRALQDWRLPRSNVNIPGEGWQCGGIGSGGHGSVYKGFFHDSARKVPVAVKLLHKAAAKADDMFLFFREVTLLHELGHPSVIKFYGAWWPEEEEEVERESFSFRREQARQRPFIVTELMDGNLKAARSEGFLSNLRAQVGALLSISEALTFLHSKSVLHLDINPENILVRVRDNDGLDVKVSDFGVSRLVRRKVTDHVTQRMAQSKAERKARREGKMEYMAPEVVLKQCRPGFASDVWSFGVLCNFVVCGETGLQDKGEIDLYDASKSGELVNVCQNKATEIECEQLSRIALACLNGESLSRPTIKDVAKELHSLYDSL